MSWSINPPTRTKRTGLGWWAKIGINVQSILSAEAFGTALVARVEYISGAGNIASAEAIGTHVLSRGPVSITPAGIVSVEAFGSPKIGPPGILPVSIITAEAFGTSVISVGGVNVAPSAIASAEAIGTQSISRGPVSIVPFGIASAETLGAPSFLATYDIILNGIAGAEAIGSPALSVGPVNIAPMSVTNNLATDPDCSNIEAWVLNGLNLSTEVTNETAYIGTTSVKAIKSVADQWAHLEHLRSPTGDGYSYDPVAPVAGQKVSLSARVMRLPSSPTTSFTVTGMIRFRQAGATMSEGAAYKSVTVNDTWQEIELFTFTPIGAEYIDTSFYMNKTTTVIGDGFYIDVISYERDTIGMPIISVGPVSIVPSGLVSGEALGNASLSRGPVSIAPSGIATEETIGAQTISVGDVSILPSAIPTQEAIGTAAVAITQFLSPPGLDSDEAIGALTVSRGAVNLAPAGIAGAEVIGSPSISRGGVSITPSGIVTGEAIGTQTISCGGVTLTGAGGIASGEAFGSGTVVDHSVRYLGNQNLGSDSSGSVINDTLPTVNATVPAGTQFMLLSLAGYKFSSATVTFTITANGGAYTLTAYGSPTYANNDSGSNQSWQQWFYLANPPTGTVSIETSRTATGFVTLDVQAFARYYQNVNSISNHTVEAGSISGTSMSISFNSTTAGAMVVCAMGADNYTSSQMLTTFDGDNKLWAEPSTETSVACGDRRGGTTVTFTGNRQDGYDYYETVVELIPA